ncbi:MAG: di-heme enzyme [Turneriella sp.]|nr:di-heme enzyme [Turneriella sp.]
MAQRRCILAALLAGGLTAACENFQPELITPPTNYSWPIPANIPQPRELVDNPMSYEKIALGRHLFYDKRLSGNRTFACATCHHQEYAFADDPNVDDGSADFSKTGVERILVARGSTGEFHPRNSMQLVNLAWQPVFTWANPLMRHLHLQALVPIFGENPIELGLVGFEDERLAEFRADPVYQRLFPQAFPEQKNPYTMGNVVRALEVFQRSIIGFDSPFDRYTRGDGSAMSPAAVRGMQLFFSEDLECFHCHNGINLTNSEDHSRKAFPEIDFANNGLYNIGGTGAYPPDNEGIKEVTGNPSDMGRFKAPTLRNVELTAPYMHDGSIADLDGVIDHYARGGRLITSGPYAGDGALSPFKSSFVKGFTLTPLERADLIEFLRSLTDTRFITNPAYSNPWPRGHFNNPD